MAVPVVLYGSKTWIKNIKEVGKIEEMKCLGSPSGCIRLDKFKNEGTRKEVEGVSKSFRT
jgi:hypothetical protein